MPLHPFGDRFRPRAFLKYLRLAWPTLFGSTIGDRYLLDYISDRPLVARALDVFATQMPQAVVVDPTVTLASGNWRLAFAQRLHGHGLEIGALHRPLPVHPDMHVTYVDRFDADTLRREFAPVADAIVPTGVVDNAETLATFPDASQDFVIAGHVIEHMRDPIGALRHWLRVLKPAGLLYLIVPDKRRSFDRKRVRTTLEHLIVDFEQPSPERDFEHFLDYAVFVHDLRGAAAVAEARKLAADDYSIHFHTFLPADVVALIEWVDAHVTPAQVVEGPVMAPEPFDDAASEFNLLVRKPEIHA